MNMTIRKATTVGLILAFVNFLVNIYGYWLLEVEYKTQTYANFIGLQIYLPLSVFNLLIDYYAIFIYFLLPPIFSLLKSRSLSIVGHIGERRQNLAVFFLAFVIVLALHLSLHFVAPRFFPLTFAQRENPHYQGFDVSICSRYASAIRGSCFFGFARKEGNETYCEGIDEFGRDECYLAVAVDYRKPEVCKKITVSRNYSTYCKAEASRNAAICDQLVSREIDPSFSNLAQCKLTVADRIKLDLQQTK